MRGRVYKDAAAAESWRGSRGIWGVLDAQKPLYHAFVANRPYSDPTASAPDALQSLAMEAVEDDDPRDTTRNLIISALAMVGLAAIVAPVGWWLLKGAMAAVHDNPDPHNGNDISLWLFILGGGAILVATVLVLFALICMGKIALRKLRAG